MEDNKVYSQLEVNKIVEEVKARRDAKFEKRLSQGYVSRSDYDNLLAQYDNLKNAKRQESVKELFKTNGGNEAAFNDFINNHKELLNKEDNAVINALHQIREQKPYYFSGEQTPKSGLNDVQEMAELFGINPENGELVGDTIYPASFYNPLKK